MADQCEFCGAYGAEALIDGSWACATCKEGIDQSEAEWAAFLARWQSQSPRGPKVYECISAEYCMAPADYYGTGDPAEYGCDVVWVRTSSARRARSLAVRYWRRMNDRWHKREQPNMRSRRMDDDENPFRGMKVSRARAER